MIALITAAASADPPPKPELRGIFFLKSTSKHIFKFNKLDKSFIDFFIKVSPPLAIS